MRRGGGAVREAEGHTARGSGTWTGCPQPSTRSPWGQRVEHLLPGRCHCHSWRRFTGCEVISAPLPLGLCVCVPVFACMSVLYTSGLCRAATQEGATSRLAELPRLRIGCVATGGGVARAELVGADSIGRSGCWTHSLHRPFVQQVKVVPLLV